MSRVIVCIAAACLIDCATTQLQAETTRSAELASLAETVDVRVLLEHPVLGWTTVDDSDLFEGANVIYGYPTKKSSGWNRKVTIDSFVTVSVYPALGTTPLAHCQKVRALMWEEESGVTAFTTSENMRRCTFAAWGGDRYHAMRGVVDAFYYGDSEYLVVVQGHWPSQEHSGRLSDYKKMMRSIVIIDH